MTVAFATLLLGLTLGVHPVTVVVADPAAEVELLLDGEPVGTATAETSWTVPVDFGQELAPHHLVAVARDAEGGELGRAGQPINLPRPAADAELVVEGGEEGRAAVARVTWESVAAPEPREVTATFDGRPLEVRDPRRIELPPFDPRQLHFLRVELDFGETVSTVVEATFGGVYQNRTQTELTAVPVRLEDGESLPPVEELEGWFATAGGEPLRAVAVEEGTAEVVMILDRAAQPELWDLARRWGADEIRGPRRRRGGERVRASDPFPTGAGRPDASSLRFDMRLNDGQTLRFLWPVARRMERGGTPVELFPRSEEHPPGHGGIFWLAVEAHQPPFAMSEQQLADAVAVAGMSAVARAQPRAVVLLLGRDPADASRFAPATVRRYLERIGVPLAVWAVEDVGDEEHESWGEVRTVDARHRFTRAVEELAATLESQRIVWVEGRHLPQDVVLTERARGVRRLR